MSLPACNWIAYALLRYLWSNIYVIDSEIFPNAWNAAKALRTLSSMQTKRLPQSHICN